jgi:hypothetical protein
VNSLIRDDLETYRRAVVTLTTTVVVTTVVNKQSEQSEGSGLACLVAQEARACLTCLR